MFYSVTLIRVPAGLTSEQRQELDDNCRHVDGRWWIMEGDLDYLSFRVQAKAEGVTTGLHPDDLPPGQPIIDHAVAIFNLGCWPPT